MSIERHKETFLRLPLSHKLIGIGSLMVLVSTFLPWYADLDAYGVGDQFLGVTGPASFVGIVVLCLSAVSLWLFSFHFLKRRTPRLPAKESLIHMAIAIQTGLMLLIVNSIYFHSKFGVNITLKESRFGMVASVFGAAILGFGSYLLHKETRDEHAEMGRLEPLIKLDDTTPGQTPAHTIREREHVTIERAHQEQPRSFMFGESESHATEESQKKDDHKGSFKIRMDL